MSLSSYSAAAGGSAVSTGMAWNPPVNHGHNHAPGQSCSADFPPSLLAPSTGNSRTRGELTGDNCTTIDLFCNTNILSAVWSEERNQCSLINDKTQAILNLTEKALEMLSQATPAFSDIEPNEIVVGKKSMKDCEMNTFYPLSELNNFNGSTEPDNTLTLEALVAPLISFSELSVANKLASTQPVVEESKSSKKSRKAKKVKKSISLVIPCGYDQNQTSKLILASAIGDYTVKNMFNRGVATVAGALYRSPRELSSLSANKQDLYFLLDDFGTKHPAVDPIVFYFHVYSLPPSNSVYYYDAALIRAEGAADAKATGNLLGFERLCTVATAGGSVASKQAEGDVVTLFDPNDAESCAEMMSVLLEQLLGNSKTDKEHVCVVMTEGILFNIPATSASPATNRAHATGSTNHCTTDAAVILTALGTGPACTIIKSLAQDAVMGGCLLSAAELDSSKQYIQVADLWTIAYQLPVADGILQAVDVAVDVQWGPRPTDQPIDQANIEVLFRRGQRLWKADVGPVKPSLYMDATSHQVKKELKWGPIYLGLLSGGKNPHGHRSVRGYPKVHLLQRVVASRDSDKKHDKEWTVLKTITPLVAKDESNKYLSCLEPVEHCQLTVSINPATGICEYAEVQGRPVRDVKTAHWSWISLALLLLSPFIGYALWSLYCVLHERYVAYQHAQWLTQFYLKHAPEKLKDPELVARTLRKYRDRMFLLWRALEKTYQVKVAPPFSIVDAAAGSIDL